MGLHVDRLALFPFLVGGRARALISPHTLRVVRRHFGCDSLAGAMLEDGGGAGTGGAHWEMRLFRDEYMTGSASPGVRASGMAQGPMMHPCAFHPIRARPMSPYPLRDRLAASAFPHSKLDLFNFDCWTPARTRR